MSAWNHTSMHVCVRYVRAVRDSSASLTHGLCMQRSLALWKVQLVVYGAPEDVVCYRLLYATPAGGCFRPTDYDVVRL